MKIVKFLGGLGNQMFQYAFYLFLKQHFRHIKADITGFADYSLHNGFELENVFNIHLEKANAFEIRLYTREKRDWITRKLRRIYGTKEAWYAEKMEFSYDSTIQQDKRPRYYWGYWQHYGYIKDIEPQVREALRFRHQLQGENARLLKEISGRTTVSLHVRRGDYVNHPVLGNICGTVYYQKAVDLMQQQLSDPVFLVFSDDISWCKTNLPLKEAIHVTWNTGENSYKDMQLMSYCKHHIIANSSFSWWGAWLNQDKEKKVIAPRKWAHMPEANTEGLLLPNWISL